MQVATTSNNASTFLDVSNELRIKIREAVELRLVEIHHEQFIGGRQIDLLRGELTIKVWHVFAMFLFIMCGGTKKNLI